MVTDAVKNPKLPYLGLVALSYVGIDYLRHTMPTWHERLQPVLLSILTLLAIFRIPYYEHFNSEFRAVIPFFASIFFLLACFLFEALSVRSVTAVLGLDWHRVTQPLPDTGQWLLLALNEKLPSLIVSILRAKIVGLHHFLILFMLLAFSVLFNVVEAPGLGLGARYMFTMAVGRLLRAVTFASTILPSARPWCATARFNVPAHPHKWAQKYHIAYASDANAIYQLIQKDIAYVDIGTSPVDYHPNWGPLSFLTDFLRPTMEEGSSWFGLLKSAGGGCNDLIYSGHMLIATLTAMAWTEAYGGLTSAMIWLLLLHSAQREIRERHHYSVDCVVAIYVGVLLWKMTGFLWPSNKQNVMKRLGNLDKLQTKLFQAAKDSDLDKVREILEIEMHLNDRQSRRQKGYMLWLSSAIVFAALLVVLLALTWTTDG